MHDIIDQLIQEAERQNITRMAMALKAGIHKVSATRYLKRQVSPSLEHAQAMAKALGCKLVLTPLTWIDHDFDDLLGTMHDKDIATQADVTVQAVAKRRTKMGIAAYKHTQAAKS